MPVVGDFTAILSGQSWGGTDYASNRPSFVTFSFEATVQSYVTTDFTTQQFINSFVSFTEAEKTVARDALAQWADVSGLIFLEVPSGEGDIRFGSYEFSFDPDLVSFDGFGFYPSTDVSVIGASRDLIGGDVFIDHGDASSTYLLLHEIGHAIGLKHPFVDSPTLPPDLDNHSNTIMSYIGNFPNALAAFDLEAVAHLYGDSAADGTQVESSSWNSVARTLTQTGFPTNDIIFGVGVRDIIDGAGGDDRIGGFQGNDALLGGDGNDDLFGNEGNDVLEGGLDDDTLIGGPGNDSISGNEGNDTIFGDAQGYVGPIAAVVQATVLEFDGTGFDATRTVSPTVVKANGEYKMLYGGLPFANNFQIGLATSTDGATWEKYSSDPVIGNAGSQAWADFREIPVTLMYENGIYKLWYYGDNSNLSSDPGYAKAFGYATSTDGINWSFDAGNPIRSELNNPAGNGFELVEVVKFGGQYHVYYIDYNPVGDVVKHAVSDDGIVFSGDSTISDTIAFTPTAASVAVIDGVETIVAAGYGGTTRYYATSIDGVNFIVQDIIDVPANFSIKDILIEAGQIKLYGDVGVGNVNWAFGNQVIQYAIATEPLGDSGDDVLDGGQGNDLIRGGAGNDVMRGGAGNDTLDGGADRDTADYSNAAGGGVTVTLGLAGAQAVGAGLGNDTLAGIENLTGSAQDDTLTGNGAANIFSGGAGKDTLKGGGGNDKIFGDDGNDGLHGGIGADRLNGGSGKDYARYDTAAAGLRVDLQNIATNTGEAVGDTFAEIEGIFGSGFADTLFGDTGANTVYGSIGNDELYGRDGDDRLNGGSGDDYLFGGAGADSLEGATGIDFARYNAALGSVRADLANALTNSGEAAGDTYLSVEGLVGSAFDDVLFGDASGNELIGYLGNDRVHGAEGNDSVKGGEGADRLSGGSGLDVFDYNKIVDSGINSGTRDVIMDFNANATDRIDLASLDAIAGGANDAFSFIGGAAFSALGQVRYGQSGGVTIVQLNLSGSTAADMTIELSGLKTLDAADFVL